MREKEERNNEGRERGERMRDNISESPLNISKPAVSKFQNFSRRAALVLKKRSPTLRRAAPFKKTTKYEKNYMLSQGACI